MTDQQDLLARLTTPAHRNALLASVTVRAFVAAMPTTPEAVAAARKNYTAQGMGDPMLKRSPDSAAMVDYWDQTDAIIGGIKTMRLNGETFLPKFTDEEQHDYDYRLKMTKMTNVYRDIVDGLAAKPFEKEVTVDEDEGETIPSEVMDFVEDVDGSGNNLTVFASNLFFSGINSAIHWIFVDHPPANPAVRSIADAKAVGARPYWSHVLGRNVLEARSKVINGDETLTYIRILEPGAPDHLRIFERLDSGLVIWTLYEYRPAAERDMEDGSGLKTHYFQIDAGVLTINEIPLVPFITGRRDGRTFKVLPAMQDAADLQVELYQEESGLKFAKKLTAYPMLAGNGVKPQMEADGKTIKKLAVGPARVLYAPPSGQPGRPGQWEYIEPNASSLTFLAKDNADTIQQLRELGRQPLTAQSGNLTVITAAVAAGKARSAVGAWALLLKDALENAMKLTCMWLGIDYEPTINVYTDFDEFAEGKDLDTLNTAVAAGKISDETYRSELKRRNVLSDEFSEDEEKALLLAQVPADNGLDTPNDPTNPDNVPP